MSLTTAADITVTDGTHGNSTFTLKRVSDTIVAWDGTAVDGAGIDSPSARPQLTLAIRRPSKSARSTKYTGKLVYPIWDTTGGVGVLKGNLLASFDFVVPDQPFVYDAAVTGAMSRLFAAALSNAQFQTPMQEVGFLR